MNIALRCVAGVLALLFAALGWTKTRTPHEELQETLPWTADVSTSTVRIVGVAELLGAVGLVLPAATGVLDVLTPIAATGLAEVMALAALTHLRRKEYPGIGMNLVLLAATVFVAWGRFGPHAF